MSKLEYFMKTYCLLILKRALRKEKTMERFELYFSDLNEETQARLLDFVEAERMEELNWDLFPIVVFDFEEE